MADNERHSNPLDMIGGAIKDATSAVGAMGGALAGTVRAAGDVAAGHADEAGKHLTETVKAGANVNQTIGDATRGASKAIGGGIGAVGGTLAGAAGFVGDVMTGKSDEAAGNFARTQSGWTRAGTDKGGDVGEALADGSGIKDAVTDLVGGVGDAARDMVKYQGHLAAAASGAAARMVGGEKLEHQVVARQNKATNAIIAFGEKTTAAVGGAGQTTLDTLTGKSHLNEQTAKETDEAMKAADERAKADDKAMENKGSFDMLKRTGGDAMNIAFNNTVQIGIAAATAGTGTAAMAGAGAAAKAGSISLKAIAANAAFDTAFAVGDSVNKAADVKGAVRTLDDTFQSIASSISASQGIPVTAGDVKAMAVRNLGTSDKTRLAETIAARRDTGLDGAALIADQKTLDAAMASASGDGHASEDAAATPADTPTDTASATAAAQYQ